MLLSGLYSECHAISEAQKWAGVTSPSLTSPQSIGSYNAGCISGAVLVPINGTGYQMMRLSRKRYYGHQDLKQFIEQLGQTAAMQQLGSLLIGDLGQPRGGPTLSGHRSHQTGLDVDIWFLLANRQLSASERESWGAPSVLVGHSDNINYSAWSKANESILEAASRMPAVDRIFVNASVKRELCSRKTNHDWLRKIRPWWKHDDHFHVRLKCPKDSKACQSQEALPPGDGCDAGLNWWFSEEAKHPAHPQKPPKPPVLPALCSGVLTE
ncbi:MAG: penicillin-insensitive murein endopeptidase [Methylococcales bacterium]|nr:penicillin-insensitive murein endopeptidase [Methylococcales bacterium]